jgi:uncharacterized OsmC-like protein
VAEGGEEANIMATAKVRSLRNLQVSVTTGGGHTVIADEPPAAGGDGAGLSPYELLLGALGG